MKFNLIESKQDWINFENHVGAENNAKFKEMRKRFQSPENDIYYWMNKPVKDLEDFLDNAEQGNFSMSEVRKGSKLVYSDSTSKIYEIANFPASHYYGKATGWCISGRYSGHWNKSATHWNQHMEQGIRFYFYFDLTKQNTMTYTNDETGKKFTETDYAKYAIEIKKSQDVVIWDNYDTPLSDVSDLPDTFPDVKDVPALHELYEEIHKYDNVDFNNVIYDGSELPEYIKYRIKGITIKDGVTEIREYAFYECESLESITIPDSVIKIGYNAFLNCKSLKSIKIPNSVTEIGYRTFSSCINLKSIEIPNSVIEIGEYAFSHCESLKSIEIPNSVIEIGKGAFYICKSLKSITIPNGVTEIGDMTFSHCTNLESINIPNSVIKIGYNAFLNCENLKSIEIPNSVTEIGEYAFYNCKSLKSITIPDSVTKIGIKAFDNCNNLTIYTNNPIAIEYAKDNKIPYKPLSEFINESYKNTLKFRLVENIF